MSPSTTTAAPAVRTQPPLLADCCSPVVGEVMTASQAETLAVALKAVADPVRLRLISLVAAHQQAEACVCDLTDPVGLSQPTVSHHLKILVDAGILTREQRGRWAYYRLVPDTLTRLADLIRPSGTLIRANGSPTTSIG
ncbi:MAG: ArsR/SmtB family transcription factor [Dermatophilaceae bacterium]